MHININQNSYPLAAPMSLTELLTQFSLPTKGMAIAVNGEVISRTDWPQQQLQDGDQLSMFRVIAGG